MGLGGAEQHLQRVSAALKRRGYEPEVFALNKEGPLLDAFVSSGVPVHGVTLPKWITRLVRNERGLAWIGLFASVSSLWWLLWRRKPAVVHFFLPAAYVIGGVVSLIGPKTIRVMSRRSLNLYQQRHRLSARIERWLHQKMTFICGNSRAVLADLSGEGVSSSKLRLIYNGIDTNLFKPQVAGDEVRRHLGIEQNSVVFVIVANLIPYKGHCDLLEAFGVIKEQLPAQWRCLLVGRDDGIGTTLKGQATKLGIEENLLFLGARRDVIDLMNASDVGVLCSHEEGFSNAIIEGMLSGLPMVVTDVGGNAEAVVHHVHGLVVPPRQPRELAQALLELAANMATRREMGLKARASVIERFSLDTCVSKYEALYAGQLGLLVKEY